MLESVPEELSTYPHPEVDVVIAYADSHKTAVKFTYNQYPKTIIDKH